ncbi:replication initiator protein A [candidate division KSB1 bacterium]|nr:replication initiator protein A [candidate division KSB1 bacterium]
MGEKKGFIESYNEIFNPGFEDLNKKDENKKSELVPTNQQLDLDLELPKTLRAEFNFLKFPFFDLAKNSKREKIEIEEEVRTSEGWGRVYWKVARSVDLHFPGDFEKRLHRAVEQILNAMPKPIQNPVRLGSLRYIAKLMGINPNSGKNIKDIQNGLKSIKGVTIEAEGSFKLKDSKQAEEKNDTFNLYNRVIMIGQKLPSGEVADAVFVELGTWYLQNINNHYVVPLDWQFYTQLKGTITTRLYEMLSIYFFAAIENKKKAYEINYTRLCNYLPITRQNPLWKAKKQLKRAHEILTESEYFAGVEWVELPDPEDWKLVYKIGKRARAEYEKNKKEIKSTLQLPPRRRALPEQMTLSETRESPLTRVLVEEWNISHEKADRFIQERSDAFIQERIDFVKQAQERPGEIKKDASGYLVRWLENPDWKFPAWYVPQKERVKKKGKSELHKKSMEYAELQEKLDDVNEFLNAGREAQIQKICAEETFWFLRQYDRMPQNTEKDNTILIEHAESILAESIQEAEARKEKLKHSLDVLKEEMQGLKKTLTTTS